MIFWKNEKLLNPGNKYKSFIIYFSMFINGGGFAIQAKQGLTDNERADWHYDFENTTNNNIGHR